MNKEEKINHYKEILPQLASLADGEKDLIVKMANFCSLLQQEMGFFWTGFYRVGQHELLLGPFQGSLACTHIGYGKGVCGTVMKEGRTLIVPDVRRFPGHIACSSLTKSEIVVPIRNTEGELIAVLDIDSAELNTFDETDQFYLEQVADFLK